LALNLASEYSKKFIVALDPSARKFRWASAYPDPTEVNLHLWQDNIFNAREGAASGEREQERLKRATVLRESKRDSREQQFCCGDSCVHTLRRLCVYVCVCVRVSMHVCVMCVCVCVCVCVREREWERERERARAREGENESERESARVRERERERERERDREACWSGREVKWKSFVVERVAESVAHVDIVMMMIAFITIKSSLVPLIEGLCAQIYFRFEICSNVGVDAIFIRQHRVLQHRVLQHRVLQCGTPLIATVT